MKKFISCIAVGMMTMGSLFADEEKATSPSVTQKFGYVDLGVGPAPLPIPVFGIGRRYQHNSNGFDVNLRVSTVVAITQAKLNLLYLHYFKPDLQKQFYMGFGPGIGGLFEMRRDFIKKSTLTLSPEFVFGKEYCSDTGAKRYFQAQISWPTYGVRNVGSKSFTNGTMLWYPLVTFHYGWGF